MKTGKRVIFFSLSVILVVAAIFLLQNKSTSLFSPGLLTLISASGTDFGMSYQGRLMDGNQPANGTYDFVFGL